MFEYRTPSALSSAWTRRMSTAPRSLRRSALRWSAALPIIAVAALLRGNAPALAEDNIAPTPVAAVAPQAEGRWSKSNAKALLKVVEASAEEGLNPADYQVSALRTAIDADQKGPALDAVADASARRLAHDYADGRIDDKAAFDWHLPAPTDPNTIEAGLTQALDRNAVDTWLETLLPSNDQYRALKAAYADASGPDRERLRTNLERWRWMPRDLGDRYIYVNVPSYRLSVMDGDHEEANYVVVVGAPKTPTPQLALQAQSVVANPSWTLPPSVLKEGRWQNKGFKATKIAGGYRVVQAPGPTNALGRIKIDMPNPHAIYLHDTPNKAAFGKDMRALSHGCIRVQNIAELAATLYGGSELDQALQDPHKTKVLQLQQSMPVYIVYFTAVAEDGGVRFLDDPYGRDAKLSQRLGAPMQMAMAGGGAARAAIH
jgi:murein L,D-transpeptidase YcbB/YkuD